MKLVKVKVLKIAGETGLRMPGSIMLVNQRQAQSFETRGLVDVVKPKTRKKKADK